MKKLFGRLIAVVVPTLAALLTCDVYAAAPMAPAADAPIIHTNASFDEPILYRAISDNGLWAVAERRPDYDGGKVINLTDWSYVTITNVNKLGEVGRPLDVSNDGNTVVGAYGNPDLPKPAVWHRETGEWTLLPFPDARFGGGYAHAVTPDGRYAVGRVMGAVNVWTEWVAMWDLQTGEFIELPGLPAPRLDTYNFNHNRITAVSPDARYMVADITPGGNVLYDRLKGTYERPKGTLPDGRTATVTVTDMSPNCRYLHGHANIAGQSAYDEDNDTWTNECIYDMATGEVTLLRESTVTDLMVWGVADDGTLYAGSGGNGTPMRDFQIYSNGYWYALDQVLWQGYGIDYYQLTQLTNTGTPYAFSADGRTFASFTDPNRGEGWVMKFNEDIADVCARVDLMANYAVQPAAGSKLSSLSTIKIGFDRNIDLLGNPTKIVMYDIDGNTIANCLSGAVDDNKFTFTFRPQRQGEGGAYRIVIPAGMLSQQGTPSLTNKEIVLEYVGRDNVPVAPKADAQMEYSMRCLDYSTNYIAVPFDNNIIMTDNASAVLVNAENNEKITDLSLGVNGNRLVIYSSAMVPLYRYSDYRIEVAAGSVTDPGGSNASRNEQVSVLIHGNWEDEPEDENTLMSENFNNGLGNKFMFYEGDHNTPTAAMATWEFTADTTPWWIARDDIYSDDYAAVSHSSYTNNGQSDDWMVIRRMYLPDATCRLQFDSQSYIQGANDHLKVYVIPSPLVYSTVTQAAIEHFRENKILIYDEIQSPGTNQETLEGEWRHNDLSLADYAGQYVYIAFVNDNKAASAVFVDNVKVSRNTTFAMSVLSPASVVDKSEQEISVKLYVNSEALDFENVKLTLLDSNDNAVASYTSAAGVKVNHANPLEVTFATPLPLAAGCRNDYSVAVEADDLSTRFSRQIKNLMFATTKRAVLEEYSGANCPNCPDGIVMIEKMKADFGDRFIPLTIRSYMGDELTPTNTDYSTRLGLDALGAPSAAVNRRYAGYAVTRDSNGNLTHATGNVENGLWYDFVVNELTIASEADMAATGTVDTDNDRVDVDVTLRYALDGENLDHSLVAVLLEDGVLTYQANGRYGSTDPLLGEWGQNGLYGQQTVYPFYCDDVVRNVSHTNLTGISGILPAAIKAGETVNQKLSIDIPRRGIAMDNAKVAVLLIDNMTGYIDNAIIVPLGKSGVNDAIAESAVTVEMIDGGIHVVCADDNAQAALFDVAGRLTATARGADVTLRAPTGVAILRVTTAAGTTVRKVAVR